MCIRDRLICIFLALYNAKRLFGCIGKGNSPFTAETASQIRKIALYVLVFAVFSAFSVFKMAFSQFFMSGLFALVLFCISLILDVYKRQATYREFEARRKQDHLCRLGGGAMNG